MNYFLRQSRARLLSGLKYVVRRELVSPGHILVKPGQTVQSTQIIAECEMPGRLDTFRLARVLGVRPDRVSRHIRKEVGDQVALGETIAERSVWGKKYFFRSPVDGTIDRIDSRGGDIVIRRPPIDFALEAGFEGEIADIIGEKAVDIRIVADVLIGVLGAGPPTVGQIEVINENQEDLEERHIDGGCCDRILISGGAISYGVIKRAMAMGVRAIVAASIPARDYIEYTEKEWGGVLDEGKPKTIGFIITEGFGRHKMRLDLLEFFHALKGQVVVLDEITGITGLGVIVPLGSEHAAAQSTQLRRDVVKMKKLEKARIIAGEQFGMIGRIVSGSFIHGEETLGADVELVRLKLDSGEEVVVPRWNIEVI
ncbi:hypothetical protein AUK40_02695 [Candidatus Wirthbacteria bacterium CG2_30_54_11]|uniref:KOW domain-containing protein n=1 Tax=Candidatus Wirthbacteria bacterium CG2_30_54_11 TaxID=1817892 RepID=A0A1J5IKM6_9BACT|nr:MAG: hypothetical protein AUK40_02695 [Candidatus Wirthbacteria bacterium CG2_30_54_11]